MGYRVFNFLQYFYMYFITVYHTWENVMYYFMPKNILSALMYILC